MNYRFADNDISYYVFKKNGLVFWSDNNLDISSITLPDSTDWALCSVAQCSLCKQIVDFWQI